MSKCGGSRYSWLDRERTEIGTGFSQYYARCQIDCHKIRDSKCSRMHASSSGGRRRLVGGGGCRLLARGPWEYYAEGDNNKAYKMHS